MKTKEKMCKKLYKMMSLLLAALMLTVTVLAPSMTASASQGEAGVATMTEAEYAEVVKSQTGFEQPVGTPFEEPPVIGTDETLVQRTAAEDAYWMSLSSNYYYDQLSTSEKAFWDRLESRCLDLVQGTESVTYTTVDCSDLNLTVQQGSTLAKMFKLSHPQYFFLQSKWQYSYYREQDKMAALGFALYDDFVDGTARMNAVMQFKTKIDGWIAQVAQCQRPEEKEKLAHDIIIDNTVYEENTYDQSAYSMVCLGKTVCAGYAATMQILMNAVGVDTVEVTSISHAWNIINLHDEWYFVDLTWDDPIGGQRNYSYYNKAEQTDYDHIQEDCWEGYAPEQPYQSGNSDYYNYDPAYFIRDNYVYFKVNSNVSLGTCVAKIVDTIGTATASIPSTIEEGGILYVVEYDIPMTGIAFAESAVALNVGESKKLEVLYLPAATTDDKTVTWYTSDSSTVSVTADGTITALKEGTAAITARCGSFIAECMVSIGGPVQKFVERMYTVVLGRAADPVGLADWTGWLLNKTVNGAQLSEGFIMSEEFLNKNVSDEEYVKILYRTFFDREADEAGKKFWIDYLEAGTSRKFVLAGFVNSDEFDALCAQYGIDTGIMDATGELIVNPGIRQFVLRLYEKVLGRPGEEGGVKEWSAWIATGQFSAEEAAKMFFASEEFINRNLDDGAYIATLYETFLGRTADAAGLASWQQFMADGMTREQVLEGFSRSDEFKKILESYGL